MDLSIIIPVIIAIVGAGASLVTANWQRSKTTAEAESITATMYITLIKPLEDTVKQLRDDLENERAAREADAASCRKAITQKDAEIAKLKAANNLLGQENASLRHRIARLEQRVGTGELTPPPHDVPGDITPTPPTRDNWQEPPPIDEPPNE